jgi:hypothetical protein
MMVACQSKTDSGATTANSASPPPTAAPQDSPGTWYRCYRGTRGSDSITLHLQTWPNSPTGRNSFVGSYSGADGQPYELGTDYDTVAKPDSVVLRDRDLKFSDATSSGPVWRLHLSGKELTGTRAGQRVQLREVELPGSVIFVSRYFYDSVAAYSNKPKSPYGRTSLHLLVPTNGPASTRSLLASGILRGLQGDTLGTQAVPASAQQYWQQQLGAFQKEYRTSVVDLVKDQPTEPDTSSNAPSYDYMLRFEDQIATHVLWNQGNLLSLGFFTYSYTGGAHGNYGTHAATFDARTGRALRFSDIFRPNTTAQLSALLEQTVRRTLRQPPSVKLDEFLFVKKMPVTRNMYLTSSGAVFIYTPYEIAAYAQGEIRLFVPLEQLRPLLKPGLPLNSGGEVSRQ